MAILLMSVLRAGIDKEKLCFYDVTFGVSALRICRD